MAIFRHAELPPQHPQTGEQCEQLKKSAPHFALIRIHHLRLDNHRLIAGFARMNCFGKIKHASIGGNSLPHAANALHHRGAGGRIARPPAAAAHSPPAAYTATAGYSAVGYSAVGYSAVGINCSGAARFAGLHDGCGRFGRGRFSRGRFVVGRFVFASFGTIFALFSFFASVRVGFGIRVLSGAGFHERITVDGLENF